MGSTFPLNTAFCVGFTPQELLLVDLTACHDICNDSQLWTITCWATMITLDDIHVRRYYLMP